MGRNAFGALRESGVIDYGLAAILGSAALFSLGEAIFQVPAALVQIVILCVGLGCSFFVSNRFRGRFVLKFDTLAYCAAAALALSLQPQLSSLLPGDPFPPEMYSAGLVTWMIVFGGFAAWRDNARLFQAVPALATFALVGVYDTFPPALFVFFVYLIAVAAMFGRAHVRSMLLQASRSGFAKLDEGISLTEAQVERESMVDAMRRGPWRAMAGIGWAFASAGVIILVSVVLAPVLQTQLRGVAGRFPFKPPGRVRAAAAQNSTLSPDSLQLVGTGPRQPNDVIVGVVAMNHARYLRTGVYDRFSGRGWGPPNFTNMDLAWRERQIELRDLSKPGVGRKYSVHLIQLSHIAANFLPAPAELLSIDTGSITPNGIVTNRTDNTYTGEAIEPAAPPGDPAHPEFLTARHIKPTMESNPLTWELATQVTHDKKTDWDKAMAIMAAIDQRAKYNLRAKAIPKNQDGVDYFLYNSHEGYCDLFATATAVMARDVGLDARYVVGYLTSEELKDQYGRYIFRQADAHSWCEIYFNGIGWVIFDATSNAQNVTPGDDADRRTTYMVVGGCLGGAAILAVAWAAIRRRKRQALPKSILLHRNLDRAYDRFARELGRRAGKHREPWMSPDAWLAETGPRLGAARETAKELNAEFVRALYAQDGVTTDVVTHLRESTKEFRRIAS